MAWPTFDHSCPSTPSSRVFTSMQTVPIIRASLRASSLDSRTLVATDGQPLALACEAPALLMTRIVAESRSTDSQPFPVRHRLLARAGRLFADATLEGQSPD